MNRYRTKKYGPQSKEPMNQLIQNPGWHLNDVKLNKLRMKMNRTMNEWRSNDEKSREQMIMFRQNLG